MTCGALLLAMTASLVFLIGPVDRRNLSLSEVALYRLILHDHSVDFL